MHEDEAVLVVDKPVGLPSVAPPGQDVDNAFGFVKEYARDKARRRGVRAWVIHRLDKEASGLLIFAKTETGFHWLKEDFRAKRVHRLYAAVVEGEFPVAPGGALAAGTVQNYLYEDERGIVHGVDSPTRAPRVTAPLERGAGEPRLAVTHYRVLAQGHGRALVQVRLETGRKHQIRVHMAKIGHPIVGDRRYGATTDPVQRVCLHAVELGFTHPGSGQMVRLRSEMPGAFKMLVGGADAVKGAEQPAETAAPSFTVSAPRQPGPAESVGAAPPASGSWEHVAGWYRHLIDERGSDHHEEVILPGTLRLLRCAPGERVLDVACGEGQLCRRLADMGVLCAGVDGSPSLIAAAARADSRSVYVAADARDLSAVNLPGPFDAAACVMALMNIEPLTPVFEGVARALRPGGRFVGVILHPAFRAPGQTSWGWDDRGRDGVRQYRRVDGYLSHGQREIVMNPGAASSGKQAVTTITYHRPLQTYARLLADARFAIEAIEEWTSARTSQPGPRAAEENRARREIPMFLAFRAVKAS